MRYISYNIEKENIMFQLELYETENGEQPVSDFLDSLDNKMAAKLIGLMDVLEEKGTELRLPYSKSMGEGIFELRCKQGSNITRVLYFFYEGKIIIVTNGFVKKTQKTPPKEIKLAKERREDWIDRYEKNKNNKS